MAVKFKIVYNNNKADLYVKRTLLESFRDKEPFSFWKHVYTGEDKYDAERYMSHNCIDSGEEYVGYYDANGQRDYSW